MATSKPAPSGEGPAAAVTPKVIADPNERQALNQAIRRRIEERAYRLYEASGREHGSDERHWLEAESEVLQRGMEVRESGSWLSINASLPGVAGDDIQVCVEPDRVIVRAQKSAAAADVASQTQGLMYEDLLLLSDLNVEVEPNTATAAFKDQKLTLMVKKRYPANTAVASRAATSS
jgi:HSP20 family molecular chaperone IbpA